MTGQRSPAAIVNDLFLVIEGGMGEEFDNAAKNRGREYLAALRKPSTTDIEFQKYWETYSDPLWWEEDRHKRTWDASWQARAALDQSTIVGVIPLKVYSYGGLTGINDYLMSDGSIKAMSPDQASVLQRNAIYGTFNESRKR